MARTKQNSGNPKPHAPTQAAKNAMKGMLIRLDMRKRDPWAITARPDEAYRGRYEDGEYVQLSPTDRYGALVPAWKESGDA